MRKELRPVHDIVACEVCGRTILKGEHTETYLSPAGQSHEVCDLCSLRAEHHGWIRESAAGDMPTMPRSEPRRGVLGRLGLRRTPEPPAAPHPQHEAELAEHEATYGAGNGAEADEYEEPHTPAPAPPPARPRSRPKDPRHVRAVPTTTEGKIERAIDLFNGSDHQRTIAGLARTLGTPFVSAKPDSDQSAQVTVVVAWELSWYRYRVDLGDEADPVMMLDKGEEIAQIDQPLREWNATLDAEGRVLAENATTDGGSEA